MNNTTEGNHDHRCCGGNHKHGSNHEGHGQCKNKHENSDHHCCKGKEEKKDSVTTSKKKKCNLGSEGTCFCPKCNTKTAHKDGVPCQQDACPTCGAKMLRVGSEHYNMYMQKHDEPA